jgi:hypothetical protein
MRHYQDWVRSAKNLVKARSGRRRGADDCEGDLLAALDPLIPAIKEIQHPVFTNGIWVRFAKSRTD